MTGEVLAPAALGLLARGPGAVQQEAGEAAGELAGEGPAANLYQAPL